MTTALHRLPRALARFPAFLAAWLLLLVGGLVWALLELTEPEGEGWEDELVEADIPGDEFAEIVKRVIEKDAGVYRRLGDV